ncbi:phospholipase C, phosphocholine-specific [soil metagenome]
MTTTDRRSFLRAVGTAAGATAAMTSFPPAIAKALSIQANRRTGTIQDVEHIVVLTQENRSFDHYFGTLNGVRGFADRFPIPVADSTGIVGKNVWYQPNQTVTGTPAVIAPFRLNTIQQFAVMRVQGTPHNWTDAQVAWDHGRMSAWPRAKQNHSMGHYAKDDLPFQWAMANAFTVCDAYHCGSQTGTNTNRLFIWTGTNDPLAKGNGPATYNDYDWFDANPGNDGGYTWTTYPERLEAAGISWQVYENMADNYTDNPLAGFHSFRAAWFQTPGYSESLRQRGVSTRDLDLLKADVLADKLPSISWIVAPSADSEHPGPSSPAQGADYTSRVIDALTSNPDVWAKTVLIINFDENDGFFDHVPPPAAPSYQTWNANPALAKTAGASTVDTTGEYHEVMVSYHNNATEAQLLHRPYGMGPRVPMYILSPWSRGGWVNSQVFDHTSIIRFMEARFGVMEPNISAWRRAVSGDLTTAFNFADPNDEAFFANLPSTLALANKSRALTSRTTPTLPATSLPIQTDGVRPSRALPYDLNASCKVTPGTGGPASARVELVFGNTGRQAGVFHVDDRRNLSDLPRRYTVEPAKQLVGAWTPATTGAYDLWVLGPNGFHRHATGNALRTAAAGQPNPEVIVSCDTATGDLVVKLVNTGAGPCTFTLTPNQYYSGTAEYKVVARSENVIRLPLRTSGYWYDFSVTVKGQADYSRRFAGRLETGQASFSDPAMFGQAIGNQLKIG